MKLYQSPPSLGYQVKKVVIDAGHGGKDSGCLGKYTMEKNITLAIALKLGYYISTNHPDVEVIYTRTKDVFVPLHERAALANRQKADLFISIHCNAAHNKAYGTETYVMGIDKSSVNLELVERENGVILMEDNTHSHYDGFDSNSPESRIIFSLYQNAYLEQSIQLASLIEDQFKYRAKRQSRGVKQESFLVLYQSSMPSVLVETGFLSNPKEEGFLNSKTGQDYIANAVFSAFKTYKTQQEGIYSMHQTKPKTDNKVYKVKLYTIYESIELTHADFEVIDSMVVEEHQGMRQYLLAKEFEDYDRANAALKKVKAAGFKNAKIQTYDKVGIQ